MSIKKESPSRSVPVFIFGNFTFFSGSLIAIWCAGNFPQIVAFAFPIFVASVLIISHTIASLQAEDDKIQQFKIEEVDKNIISKKQIKRRSVWIALLAPLLVFLYTSIYISFTTKQHFFAVVLKILTNPLWLLLLFASFLLFGLLIGGLYYSSKAELLNQKEQADTSNHTKI